MSRRVIRLLLALGACAAASCDHPAGPSLGPRDAAAPPPRFDIVDAAHAGGNPFFFFLSPLVADPTATGTFDATELPSLAVDVCERGFPDCAGAPFRHFTASSGTTLERIRLDATRRYYLVYWNTGDAPVATGIYRVAVRAGATRLGLIDVAVMADAKALAAVDRRYYAGAVKGDWLPIRFRIDEGALSYNSAPTVTIRTPVEGAHFWQGAPVQFNADATDLQEGTLTAQIQWTADGTLALGTGARVTTTFPAGEHVAVASVTDARGVTGRDTVRFTVDPAMRLKFLPGSYSLATTLPTSMTIQLQNMGLPVAAPPGGVSVALASSDAACVRPRTTPVVIAAGLQSTSAAIEYGGSAAVPCTAKILATATGVTADSAIVHVTAATLSLGGSPKRVGSGLVNGAYVVRLAPAAPAGGVVVHLAPDDNTLVLLSAGPYTPGYASLDLNVPAGQASAIFHIQGVEGRTGTTTLRATVPGYPPASAAVDIVQPGYEIRGLPTTTAASSRNIPFLVAIGIASATNPNVMAEQQPVRTGGPSYIATITNSAAGVAQLVTFGPVTGQTGTVSIDPGRTTSISSGAGAHGIDFDPLGPGTTTVTAVIPGWHAFPGATRTVTVTVP